MLTVDFESATPHAAILRARPFVDLDDPAAEQAIAELFRLETR
jgi:hypothetical protein